MRRRLARYRGKIYAKLPDKNEPKSTKLAIWDFPYLTGIEYLALGRLLNGSLNFGPRRTRKLSRALFLADGGYVQKLQHKKYIIHDKPFQPAVRECKVQISLTGGVKMMKTPNKAEPNTLPGFMDLFKQKG